MATLSSSYLNLIDVHKANQSVGPILNVLKKQNPILDDAVAMECNDGSGHNHDILTGLPEPGWGALYKGIKQGKSTRQSVRDTTGFLEARSAVDIRVLERAKRPAELRMAEASAHLEAMNQEMASGMFYHSQATTPEKFTGLAPRYSVIGGGGAGNQVVDGGGLTSANTSIWFVCWADHATHLLYPEGSQAGIKRQDKGEQRILDSNGDPFFVKEEVFTWHMGVAVKDWRYNARVANIDVAALLAGNVDIHSLMIDAYYKLQSTRYDAQTSRIACYMNRGVLAALDKLSSNIGGTAKNSALILTPQQLEGKMVKTWRDIPIRECDALLNTEARVLAA